MQDLIKAEFLSTSYLNHSVEFCNRDVVLSYILWDGLNILYESYHSLLNLWVLHHEGDREAHLKCSEH